MPLLELAKTQFVLMSATLGDVERFQRDLTRRTGRTTAVVTSAQRPVPLSYSWALTPLHETLEELLTRTRRRSTSCTSPRRRRWSGRRR